MTTDQVPNPCPRCGAPIPPDAPAGQCPKCLLQAVVAPTEPTLPASGGRDWPTLEEVQAAFPELQLEGEIGRGGMAVVFKARQPHLDRIIALKILAPWLAGEPGFAERFSREARVLAKLNHPNIVTIHDFGQAARFFYLMMEFVDGVNLRQAMQAGRFTPQQALGLVPKICDALQYAHGEGVLHRDIKPDNILLDAKGRVKIADFGIAKLAGEAELPSMLTRSGMHLGTPAYMAPEQMEHPGEVDHRADIYSLGVVLYEMLTGELPLGRFAAPSEKSAVDERIDEIVFRTLEKERERRYQSAGEVKTKVEGLGAAAPVVAAAAGPPPLVKRALVGALCSAISLASALIFVAASATLSVRETGPHEPSDAGMALISVIALVLTVAAVFAPGIAGIFLGATGLTTVRESGGKAGGAGFGTFAVLAWPLLILTGIVIGMSVVVGGKLFGNGFSPTVGGWLFAATVLGGVLGALRLDYLIVRKTLRWARCQEETKA
jgi:tRNA A-37 threonylcarbamoyl transferase component Bud32